MKRRKFEEEVVEETTTETTETVEESPDYHEQFVTILVDMGLSAEQAEAVHSMAMDLINAGDGETKTTEEVNEETKVEARRARRGMSRRKPVRRAGMSETRSGDRRRRFAAERNNTEAMNRRMRRLSRQNRMLREQLQQLGATPAAQPLRNRPTHGEKSTGVGTNGLSKSTVQALDMINNYGK